jgi:hypothetical protein
MQPQPPPEQQKRQKKPPQLPPPALTLSPVLMQHLQQDREKRELLLMRQEYLRSDDPRRCNELLWQMHGRYDINALSPNSDWERDNGGGESMLNYALRSEPPELEKIALLLLYGADPLRPAYVRRYRAAQNAIEVAARSDSPHKYIRRLFGARDVNSMMTTGAGDRTATMYACEKGLDFGLQWLVERRGAQLDRMNASGENALDLAMNAVEESLHTPNFREGPLRLLLRLVVTYKQDVTRFEATYQYAMRMLRQAHRAG